MLMMCFCAVTDDDIDDETFNENPTSPQDHSPLWKSPALEPRTRSPKTSTGSPASSSGHHYKHSEKSPPGHPKPATDHDRHAERSTTDHPRPTEKKPEHDTDRHNDTWTHELSQREEKTESSPNYYQRHRDTTPAGSSQKTDKVPPPVPGMLHWKAFIPVTRSQCVSAQDSLCFFVT